MNARLSERLAIVAVVDPATHTTGAKNGSIIDMKLHRRVMFIVQAGTLGSSATLNFKVESSAAANMTPATDITGAAITALTQAGTDSNKQAVVEIFADDVLAKGHRYIRGILTVGTANSGASMVAVAGDTRYQPASEYDLASVAEIVA